MSAALYVVYATDRDFRTGCDALLRRAGARVRLASRQTELFKSMRDGDVSLVIVDANDADMIAARSAISDGIPIMQRAPGESIEQIVGRALVVVVQDDAI